MIKFYEDHSNEIINCYLFFCCMGFFTYGAFEDVSYVGELFGISFVNSEPFIWVFKYLFAPCLLIILFLYIKELPKTKFKTFQRDIFTHFVFLLAIFVGSLSGFFQLANATLGEQTPVKICGEAVKYHVNTNSKNVPTSYEVTVRDGNYQYILKLSKNHFDSLSGNNKYCEEWTRGSLGFLYRWK